MKPLRLYQIYQFSPRRYRETARITENFSWEEKDRTWNIKNWTSESPCTSMMKLRNRKSRTPVQAKWTTYTGTHRKHRKTRVDDREIRKDIKSLISLKIWYNNLVFQDKGNISPLKNPSWQRDFSLLILAFPLHNSLIDTRYFYPYQAMLPVGKFQDKLLHKKKWLGDISPCSFWKQGASKLYIFLRKINFTEIHHSDHKICSHFSLQEATDRGETRERKRFFEIDLHLTLFFIYYTSLFLN